MIGRTSILTFAAVATFAVAATTEAWSFCPGMNHGRGGFSPVPQHRNVNKVAKVKAPKEYDRPSKVAIRNRPVAEPVKPTSLASAPKPTVTSTASSTSVAPASVQPAATATPTCLSKEYLDTGAVRFKDTCTKEWAINSTQVEKKAAAVGPNCLTKENNQNGVVMFRDVCTNEWAMNTVDQSVAQAR